MEKLKNIAVNELGEKYNIQVPQMWRPKIVVVGMHDKHLSDESELVQSIGQQHFLEGVVDRQIKIVKKYKPKNKEWHNVVVEVSSEIFQLVMKRKKLFLGWDSYHVEEYIGLLRCYKCWKYGHKAAVCHREHAICPLCNENHGSAECTSQTFQCTNCKYAHEVLKLTNVDYNHTVFDKNCSSYKRAVEQYRARVKYAQ